MEVTTTTELGKTGDPFRIFLALSFFLSHF